MTADNAEEWPTEQLPLGLLAGYRYQDHPRHSRTSMASGPPRTRLTSRSPIREYHFDLLLTDGQLAKFETWLERNLDGGTRWFWLPLRDGTGLHRTLVQFQKLTGPAMQGQRWKYSCQCISYQRHALNLTDAQIELLLRYSPTWLKLISNKLHRIVHREW